MTKNLRFLAIPLFILFIFSYTMANVVPSNSGGTGTVVNILESRDGYTKIEYIFNGYETGEIKINGKTYLSLLASDMNLIMEKGNPEILTFKRSLLIPDNSAMNYRILSQEFDEINTLPVMPSKGHFTRDIDPNSIPYTFGSIYKTDKYFPENIISLESPYIVRDFRGMTVQFNPLQYNAVKGKMKITKRLIIEVYTDNSLSVVNPLIRNFALSKVSGEYAPIYRNLFMNYGIGQTRFDSIPEPGKMLVICPTGYMTAIQPFVEWKQQRGLNVTVAEYPTATGSGNAAIKTYIQNMYNSLGSVTYIILVGDVADIPTLNGVSESAPSDPCYVKLAGTDAYPDAFISRISCQSAANISYVTTKFIKFERDIEMGAPWYNMGTGIGGPDVGGTPSYADSIRMNWVRDTLMAHGFTLVDKVNGPIATAQTLINVLNQGRYVLNYIGHGSGTSWSNTGFSVSNVSSLANGWKQPFLVDVACLNGNFTLNECLAEALLRSGDVANPRGCSSIYASSTNASWVPPCDMQAYSMRLLANQFRKTAGAISFFGVMKAMDINGGSTGEGLKLMEQYNIFGDCSLLLTRGVPLGPSIAHTQFPNTENLAGPFVINCNITPANAPLKPNSTKLFWSRNNTTMTDSLLMTNTSGNNWAGNIPGNGSSALYRYCIKTIDTANRVGVLPGGLNNYFQFTASPDILTPVITHTPLGDIPRANWPAVVTANVTDNIGVDSVWVKWYKNIPANTKQFRLPGAGGNVYSAAFNSIQSEVNFNDSIFYRVYARDNSSNHNADSTALYKFKIISQTTICLGTGTTATSHPFYTLYEDSRTQMLYTASEIVSGGGSAGFINKIGFKILTIGSPAMSGFSIKMQTITGSTISTWTNTGWTNVYSGTYTPPGIGLQYIDLQTPFLWNGSGNLLVEVCFDNAAWTSNSTVEGSAQTGMVVHNHIDGSSGCTLTATSTVTTRPNVCLIINTAVGVNPIGSTMPKTYSLGQNYPNPFNPTTQIRYDIPKQSFVTLKVYDLLGREITKLVNEVKQPGNYIIDFNASHLSSGVYFYKLQAGEFESVKRMVLVK